MRIKKKLRDIASLSPTFVHAIATKMVLRQLTKHLMKEQEVLACENNDTLKETYVRKYRRRFPSVARLIDKKILLFINKNTRLKGLDKKELEKIELDINFCYFAYGTQVDEYIFMDFHNTIVQGEERRRVVSDTEQHIIRLCANDITHAELSDKARAYNLLKEFYKRNVIVINGFEDRERFEIFIKRNKRYVKKLLYSSRGKGVQLCEVSGKHEDDFNCVVKEGKVLLEELIEQSDDIAVFNPKSVNTVRISTFLTNSGVVAPWGFFRMGRKDSFIDNAAAGGVFAAVDTKLGEICTNGCDEDGNRYEIHPDSGVHIKGFKLPDWQEALQLCKKAALLTPEIKYLSWDLAYSKKYGWMIVEVNTCGQFIQQAALLKGLKTELKAILDDMELVVPYKFIRE